MIVKNPTQNRLQVQLDGIVYVVEPFGELTVKEVHARRWKEHIHEFIDIVDEKDIKVEPKKEEPREPQVSTTTKESPVTSKKVETTTKKPDNKTTKK